MSLRLEIFEPPGQSSETVVLRTAEFEDMKLRAYEQGYSAGWEDSVSAMSQEEGRISADLANNLQNLAFTYQEARTHLLSSLRPVLVELTTRLLPELAREALAPIVLDTLMPLVDQVTDQTVHLILNPSARPAVERMVSQAAGLPMIIEEEPTLGEGQVYLKFGARECRVDLDQAIQDICRAVRDFFDYSEKE